MKSFLVNFFDIFNQFILKNNQQDNLQTQNQNQQQQPPQPQQQSGWQIFQSMMTRMLIFYLAMQAMNYFKGRPPINPATTKGDGLSPLTNPEFLQPGNLFQKGTKFVIH